MSIRPGTLCLLLAPHGAAGRCCVVVSTLQHGAFVSVTDGEIECSFYLIELSDGSRVTKTGFARAARPFELVPISDPDYQESDDKRTRLEA